MLINVRELNKIKCDGFLKSHIAEKALLLLISNSYGYQVTSSDELECDSSGDGFINNHQVEIKFSCAGSGANGYHIFIETNDKHGRPSGLSDTKSKFYITVTTGWSTKLGPIGKVRLWHVSDLKRMYQFAEKFTYPNGGSGFFIKPKLFDNEQIWLGDVSYDKENQTFDISKFIMLGSIYKIKEALK